MQKTVTALPIVTESFHSREKIHIKYSRELLGAFQGGTIIVSEDTGNNYILKELAQEIHGIHTHAKGTVTMRPSKNEKRIKIDQCRLQVTCWSNEPTPLRLDCPILGSEDRKPLFEQWMRERSRNLSLLSSQHKEPLGENLEG